MCPGYSELAFLHPSRKLIPWPLPKVFGLLFISFQLHQMRFLLSAALRVSSGGAYTIGTAHRSITTSTRLFSDEVKHAVAAAVSASASASHPTIFDKILSKEIPSTPVFEDDEIYAFDDAFPKAPVHILVIPKVKGNLSRIQNADPGSIPLLGNLLHRASIIGKEKCGDDGFRIVINDGKDGAQSVYHLHLHVIGGRQLDWPPG